MKKFIVTWVIDLLEAKCDIQHVRVQKTINNYLQHFDDPVLIKEITINNSEHLKLISRAFESDSILQATVDFAKDIGLSPESTANIFEVTDVETNTMFEIDLQVAKDYFTEIL